MRETLITLALLLALVAPGAAQEPSWYEVKPLENRTSLGVTLDDDGAYQQGAIQLGHTVRHYSANRWFGARGSAAFGNGVKTRRGEEGEGHNYGLALDALVCPLRLRESTLCVGPTVSLAGYETEFQDGTVWEKDDTQAGVVIGWEAGRLFSMWLRYREWNDDTQERYGTNPEVQSIGLSQQWFPVKWSGWGVGLSTGAFRIRGDRETRGWSKSSALSVAYQF